MVPPKYLALVSTLKCKSVTKAANQLGYTQSNISQMLSALERELNVPLLNRTKKGIFPTAEAQQLLPMIEQIIYMENSLIQSSFRLQGVEIGRLRVGTFLSVSLQWLPHIVSSYLQKHPNIELQFLVGTNEEICRWFMDGEIDIAITSDLIPDKCKFIPLIEDPIRAIVSKSNPLAQKEIISLEELCEYPFLIPYESSDKKIDHILAAEKLKPKIRFRIKGGSPSFAMVNQNLGVTLTHRLAVLAEISSYPQIVAKPLYNQYSRVIGVCVQNHSHTSFIEQSFLDEIRKFIHDFYNNTPPNPVHTP